MNEPSRVRQRVSDLISQWRKTQRPNALAAMGDLPELRQSPTLAIDLAYEEFCLRSEAGENLDTKTFCGQFPTIQYSLARMIDVHRALRSPSLGLNPCPETKWPEAGECWLNWDLGEPLGRGAFSRVFLAREFELGNREVVLKVTLSGPHEASILGRLAHPHIGPVHSIRHEAHSGLAGISMPLLGTRTLADLLNHLASGEFPNGNTLQSVSASGGRGQESGVRGLSAILLSSIRNPQSAIRNLPSSSIRNPKSAIRNLPSSSIRNLQSAIRNLPSSSIRNPKSAISPWQAYLESVVSAAAKLAQALAAAHRQGIIHGDIKPSNVLLSFAGEPILLDFNLSGGSAIDFAHWGGTPPYMAPERWQQFLRGDVSPADHEADPRGDVFSLGVVLLELLHGPLAIFTNLAEELPQESDYLELLERPTLAGEVLDPALQSILARCLAFNIEDRFSNADALAIELNEQLTVWRKLREPLASPLVTEIPAAVSVRQIVQKPRVAVALVAVSLIFIVLANGMNFISPLQTLKKTPNAQSFIESGDFLEAGQALRRDDLEHPSPELKAWAGYCFAKSGSYRSARRMLEMAIQERPDSAELWNNLGYCDLHINRNAEARVALDRAVLLNPELQAAYHNRALLQLNQWNNGEDTFPADIWRDFEAAIACQPANGRLHFDAASFLSLAQKRNQKVSGNLETQVVQALACGESLQSFSANRFLFSQLNLHQLELTAKQIQNRSALVESQLLLPPSFPVPVENRDRMVQKGSSPKGGLKKSGEVIRTAKF